MKRRAFLKRLFTASLATEMPAAVVRRIARSILVGAGVGLPAGATTNKDGSFPSVLRGRVRPADREWPTEESWSKLKEAVGGNLVRVESPLAPCRLNTSSAAAKEVLDKLANPYFVGDQVGGTQTSGWLDAWTPKMSAYAVAARTTRDVAAAVDFVRRHNLRLTVKGGGHSYLGTSNATDSLMIWTRAMNKVTVHDAFVAEGCAGIQEAQPAVTIESGAMWMDAYHAVVTMGGRYVQGGGCATVGVAGLIQGGGFGSFSKKFGLAAASLLQAEVVTADGAVLLVNANKNPDLFWAIKGGGGGSWGVLTKITLKTHELPDYFGGMDAHIQAHSDAAYKRLIDKFLSFYRDSLCNPHWGESVKIRPDNSLEATMVFQGLDEKAAAKVWQPFLHWIEQLPQDYQLKAKPGFGSMPARRWWDGAERLKQHSECMIPDRRPGAPPFHVYWSDNQNEVGIFIHGYESVWLHRVTQGGRRSQLLC